MGKGHGAASRQRPAVNSQFALGRSEGSQCFCHRPGGAWEAGRGVSRAPYRLGRLPLAHGIWDGRHP